MTTINGSLFSLLLLLISVLAGCSAVIEIEQGAFKLYRQEQTISQKNHIKLRFKTIQATGLIMFVQGANKKDFLTVELVRGKIRVAANYGTYTFLRCTVWN